jgi:hypothetical protein
MPKWQVSFSRSPAKTRVDRTIKYSGSVKTDTGKTGSGMVVIQKRPVAGGDWINWKTVRLKPDGSYSLVVKMNDPEVSQVRARMSGTPGERTGFSATRRVTVRRR